MTSFHIWCGIASLVMFVGGLAATGYVLLRLPTDYFSNSLAANPKRRFEHPALHIAWCITRNLLGVGLVVAGIVMLFLPGQGLITLVVGLMLVDFPGKRKLSLELIRRWHLIEAANKWRARYDRPPFELPEEDEAKTLLPRGAGPDSSPAGERGGRAAG